MRVTARAQRDGAAADVLIPFRCRRALWGLVALSWMVVVGLGVHYAGTAHPGPLDATLTSWVRTIVGDRTAAARALTWTSAPPVVYAVIAATAIAGLRKRRWEFAALAVAGPALAVALVELAGKPLANRHLTHYLCYPSGHTASAVSALTAALLVLAAGAGPTLRLLALAVWTTGTCAVALGLVAMHYHYPTDVLGGVALVLGTVPPMAALADTAAQRRLRRLRNGVVAS